jgi:archaellum biogenesis ATPase FlaH
MTDTIYRNNAKESTVSPLDKPLKLTRFKNRSAQTKKETATSLRAFADEIRQTFAGAKEELPWFKTAAFGTARTPLREMPDGRHSGNSLRHNANVLSISGVEADYDAGLISTEEANAMLQGAGLAALIYETPSHSSSKPRWRVVCPTSGDLPPSERERLVARLNGVLGGILAPESFVLSQAYFFGSLRKRRWVNVHLVEGRFIDQASELDEGAIGKRGKASDKGEESHYVGEKTGRPLRVIVDALFHIPNDDSVAHADRDWWRDIGAALHMECDGSEEGRTAFHEWSARHGSYDPDHTDQTWDSLGPREGRVKTGHHILAEARKSGWRDLEHMFGVFDAEVLTEEDEAEIEALIREHVGGGTKDESETNDDATGLTFLKPSECELSGSRRYVIKGLVAEGDIACIVGAPGVGKSLLAPRLGYAVAQGSEIFGMRVRQGSVLYVAAEDQHGMRARVAALRREHGEADDFALVAGVSDLLNDKSKHLKRLRAAVKDRRPSLIIIDTLSMAFPGLEENSAEGMGRVVAVARSLTKWGAAVILIHHDTKDGQQGLPRGHSLLNGALDVSIHLTKAEGIVRAKLTKNRNGSCERDIAFTIGEKVLGVDEDGEPITTAVCRELPPGMGERAEARMSPSVKAAYSIFLDLLGDGESVAEGEWRKMCVDGRKVSASDEPDSRRKAFKRAAEELTRAGKIAFDSGRYFLPKGKWETFEDEDE